MNVSERQYFRNRATGRYRETPKCEVCGRNPRYAKGTDGKPIDYFSHRRLETPPFSGRGLVLCKKCCHKIDQLPDAEALAILTAQRQAGQPA